MNPCEMFTTTSVGAGQLRVAHVLVHLLERRDDLDQHHADHADRDDEDADRVVHRALELALQLDGLLDVDRESVQDRVEDAADLAGRDEVDVELVEDLRMLPERVGERRALLDAVLHAEQDLLERLVLALVREDVEALHERQAGVDHRRELAREDLQILRPDAGADLDVDVEVDAALAPHARVRETFAAQPLLARADAVSASTTPLRFSPARVVASHWNLAMSAPSASVWQRVVA